jgi:hypothetical protein
MEEICSSETSVRTKSTQRHIPEDGILQGITSLIGFFADNQQLTMVKPLITGNLAATLRVANDFSEREKIFRRDWGE